MMKFTHLLSRSRSLLLIASVVGCSLGAGIDPPSITTDGEFGAGGAASGAGGRTGTGGDGCGTVTASRYCDGNELWSSRSPLGCETSLMQLSVCEFGCTTDGDTPHCLPEEEVEGAGGEGGGGGGGGEGGAAATGGTPATGGAGGEGGAGP